MALDALSGADAAGLRQVAALHAGTGEERLEATPLPAAAPGSARIEREMPPLAGNPLRAGMELATHDDPAPHSGPEDDPRHHFRAPPRAESGLGEREAVRIVR